MFNDKQFLAIIPARSGSKGLKDKNIKGLNGKPMIAYTIEAAKKSEIFDDIIVSTDSERYAKISREYGAEVPFLRPEYLSSDTASTMDVLEYTILELEKQGRVYDYFMLLQPTSPLRDEKDIIGAVNLMFEKSATSIVSVCPVEHSPKLMNTLDKSLNMENFLSRESNKRRQELPDYYRLNGAMYLTDVNHFLKHKDFYSKGSYAYVMDRINSIDVDELMDLKIAECIMKESN